jgi:methylated-DNA-[protein]-cysteine S-methyltransferase
MKLFADSFSTPFGPFSAAFNPEGALVATAFGDLAAVQKRYGSCDVTLDRQVGRNVREQVLAYCAGDRIDFTVPLAARGTAFQNRVWSALREIPLGETRSYGQLAAMLGSPAASRAVGRANATNPICLIVPCHRVIGSDGSLTGFAFGEQLKQRLLDHEQSITARSRAA